MRRHIPALDGVRGIAVLGVLAHHLGHLTGGYLGVDAFFVLSGLLITGLLLDESGTDSPDVNRIALGEFWIRRAKRLLPALVVVLGVVVVVETWVIDGGIASSTLRSETLASLFYVFNWQAIANDVDYWATFEAPSPLRHMWSLAIEEQFYVLWPLAVAAIVLVARRRGVGTGPTHRTIGWVAGVLAAGSAVWGWVLYDGTDTLRVYYGTDTRVAAILFGATAAVLLRRFPQVAPRHQRLFGVVGLILVVPVAWAWATLEGTSSVLYRGGLTVTGLMTTIIIAATVMAPDSLLSRGLSVRPLRWFGSISYGLYLWHWPIIVWLTPDRTGLDGLPLLTLRIALSLAATLASFHLLEQPIRRSSPSGRSTLAVAIPAVAVVTALTLVVTSGQADETEKVAAGTRSTAPIPTRPPAPTATPDTVTPRTTITTDEITPDDTTPDDTTATTSVASEPARLMVLGDSGAYFLGELLSEVADPERALVLPRGEVGCGIINVGGGAQTVDGVMLPDPEGCDDWPARWTSDATAFEPDVTLIVLSWPGIGERDLSSVGGSTSAHPCDDDFDRHYGDRMEMAIRAAGSGDGRVVVATNPYYSGPGADGTFVQRVDCLNLVMTTTAQRTGADILDLAGWTCPDGICRLEVDGSALRPDGLHFDGPGGRVAAEWALGQLLP